MTYRQGARVPELPVCVTTLRYCLEHGAPKQLKEALMRVRTQRGAERGG